MSAAHDLYRQFIEPGDLVFDIGANVGLRTSVFLDLGARVIAVEPQRESAEQIDPRATVILAGVGSQTGFATLLVCDEPACSTFSPQFIADLNGSGLLTYHWDEKRVVPIVTLDDLIERYGLPAFCKIDVEGYELPVLQGLTHALDALSFEAHAAQPEKWQACLAELERYDPVCRYEYAYSARETFELSPWGERFEVGEWGDIYARRIA